MEGWVWDANEADWEDGLSRLQQYVTRQGDARVPDNYRTPDGHGLGSWVGVQRRKKDQLSVERRTRLEALEGWVWDANEAAWEDGFFHLQQYVEQQGNARVPQPYTTPDDYGLGAWVAKQRREKVRARLSPERQRRLEALPRWAWNPHDADWEEGYAKLREYVDANGDARVPTSYRTPDKHRLGHWVSHQRSSRAGLSPDQQRRLEALPGWTWDLDATVWEERFARLHDYVNAEGDARVPVAYTAPDGDRLGKWINMLRTRKQQLSTDQQRRLEQLPGWTWDLAATIWEERFAQLQEYVNVEGHARVPVAYTTPNGDTLGTWARSQRRNKQRLSPAQQARLKAPPVFLDTD